MWRFPSPPELCREEIMFDIQVLKEKIRFYRRQAGLTQIALAEKLGVSFQAVSNWETGTTVPDIENLCTLAQFFGVSLDILLRSKEDASEQYLIGVDGGGTKSEFVLFTSAGNVVKHFYLPGTNASTAGAEEAGRILCQGIDLCMQEQVSVSGIYIGNAGGLEDLRTILTERYFQIPLRLVNDSMNALHCAEADGAVICGTGSFVVVREADKVRTLGGWGYRLGDPASAYNFGKEALRNAMFYEDGIHADGTLHFLLTRKMGVSQLRGALTGKSQAYISSLAAVVFEAYAKGSADAEAIINTQVRDLAELIRAGLPRGGTVVAGGGILCHYQNILLPRLEQQVENTTFVVPDVPMVYGACVAACQEFGISRGPDFKQNFKNDYRTLAASDRKQARRNDYESDTQRATL